MATKTKRIELNNSGVTFIKETHQYFLNGRELSGITPALHKMLAEDEYKGIPDEIMSEAQLRGTRCHESIEQFTTSWINDGSKSVSDFIQLCKDNNLCSEAAEYLVTDYENFASAIDCVFRVGPDSNVFDLGDIKTMSKLTPTSFEKVKYQLNIYSYMFTLVNPKATVRHLFVIHIRETDTEHIAEIIPIPRIEPSICQALLQAYLDDVPFDNPYSIPEDISSMENEIRFLQKTKTEAEERLNSIRSEIMSRMTEMNVKSWCTDTMKLTLKAPTTRSSFNLKLFQADHPEYNYEDYMKTTTVSPSLLITL